MTDMTVHAQNRAEDAGGAKGAAMVAMFLWVVVILSLAYGLYNTLVKVVDLFG